MLSKIKIFPSLDIEGMKILFHFILKFHLMKLFMPNDQISSILFLFQHLIKKPQWEKLSYSVVDCLQTLLDSFMGIPNSHTIWGHRITTGVPRSSLVPPCDILDDCFLMLTMHSHLGIISHFNLVYFIQVKATLLIYTFYSKFVIKLFKLLEKKQNELWEPEEFI